MAFRSTYKCVECQIEQPVSAFSPSRLANYSYVCKRCNGPRRQFYMKKARSRPVFKLLTRIRREERRLGFPPPPRLTESDLERFLDTHHVTKDEATLNRITVSREQMDQAIWNGTTWNARIVQHSWKES